MTNEKNSGIMVHILNFVMCVCYWRWWVAS